MELASGRTIKPATENMDAAQIFLTALYDTEKA
jgi:hypothetical protein